MIFSEIIPVYSKTRTKPIIILRVQNAKIFLNVKTGETCSNQCI
jgi:hypothetical protein